MATGRPEFPSFDVSDLSKAGPTWEKWIKRFELLLGAMNVRNSEQDKLRKRCLLLHYLGAEPFEIYETLDDETATYDSASSDGVFYYERYVFRNTLQIDGEDISPFSTRIKKRSVNCDFESVECPTGDRQ